MISNLLRVPDVGADELFEEEPDLNAVDEPMWRLLPSTTPFASNRVTPWRKGVDLSWERAQRLGLRPDCVEAIRYGVDLMFDKPVKPFFRDNYSSVRDHLDAVVAELDRLERMGKIEPVAFQPFVVSPMGVIVKPDSGKVRIVLDTTVSGLNDCLRAPKMTLPSLATILGKMAPGFFQAKHDLADAFMSIPVRPEQCDVLGIRHPVTGQFYRYRYLCFGLACAPFIFQSFMEATRDVLSRHGVDGCVPYVDDWWMGGPSFEVCAAKSDRFEKIIDDIGFRRALHKKVGPAQRIDWCGIEVCTTTRTVGLTMKKIEKARRLLDQALSLVTPSGTLVVPLKSAHSLSGYLTHVSMVVLGGTTCLRNLWTDVGATQVQLTWAKASKRVINETQLELSVGTVADLKWWRAAVDLDPRRPLYVFGGTLALWNTDLMRRSVTPPDFCRVITMDASSVGWGFWYKDVRVAGLWTEEQSHCSSNWRELKTMSIAIRTVHKLDPLTDCAVLGVSDNSTTVAYTNKGHGRSESLMTLVREIRNSQLRIRCEIVAVHLAGKANGLADSLSRAGTDLYRDRALSSSHVKAVEQALHCRVTAVALATVEHPGSRQIVKDDSAFDVLNWAKRGYGVTLWIPGPHQIVRTIKHLWARQRKERHVLLVPKLATAGWWRMLARACLVQQWDSHTQLFANAPATILEGVRGAAGPGAVYSPWAPRLIELAAKAAEIEMSGLAPATVTRYQAIIDHIMKEVCGEILLPMNEEWKVTACFASYAGRHWSQVEAAKAAVTWWHKSNRLDMFPLDCPNLSIFWRGLKKSCVNIVKGKAPIAKEHFRVLVEHWVGKRTWCGLRDAFVACVQFYAMRRISEVLSLHRSQIRDEGVGKGVALIINRQKNDPYGRGMEVPLPEVTNDGFPLGTLIRKYCEIAPTQGPFIPVTRGRFGWGDVPKPLSADAWNRAIRTAIAACNLPVAQPDISSHSFRKGGCTRALQINIPQDCIMDIAGWNDPNSMLSYGKRTADEKKRFIAML